VTKYALAVLLLVASRGQAQSPPSCSDLHVPTLDSQAAFIEASLIGLRYAQSAWNEGAAFDREKEGLAPTNLLIAMMRHTKLSSEAYACASQLLAKYENSANKTAIGFPAQAMTSIYKQHQRLNDTLLQMLRSLPDTSTTNSSRLADGISTLQVERGKLWTDLTRAVTLSAMLLIDQSKVGSDGNLNAILLTKAESDRLIKRIEEDFPDVGSDASSTPTPARLAGLYHQFLKRPYARADK
jgi:hypothetical protein